MHGNRVTAIYECFHDGFATGDPILLVVADDVCCVNPLLPVSVAPSPFEGDGSEHNHRGILALAHSALAAWWTPVLCCRNPTQSPGISILY
jgi:hypothetical protein